VLIKPPTTPIPWSRSDYALATAFAASLLALAPALMVPPLLVAAFLPPRN
jgi:hypothetical protein